MTWAELHGALRGRGLIRADDALRAEAAVGMVTGIAYDSRTVAPGEVFVALKGQHSDGTIAPLRVHDRLNPSHDSGRLANRVAPPMCSAAS